MKRLVALGMTSVLIVAVTGCSSDSKTASSATKTSASTKSAAAPTTPQHSESKTAVNPSSLVTGSTQAVPTVAPSAADASLAAPSQIQFAIGSQPFGPTSVASNKLSQSINSSLPMTGVAGAVTAGTTLKPAEVTRPVSIVWMNASSVLDVTQVAPCSGSCPTLSAPSGASKVMVIPQSQIPGIGVGAPVTAG